MIWYPLSQIKLQYYYTYYCRIQKPNIHQAKPGEARRNAARRRAAGAAGWRRAGREKAGRGEAGREEAIREPIFIFEPIFKIQDRSEDSYLRTIGKDWRLLVEEGLGRRRM